MSNAIPKSRLPHTVVQNAYTDGSRGGSYGANTTINNVKVDEAKVLRTNKEGKEIVGNATMFYDYVNSTSATFNLEDKITFKDRTYRIVDIEILYANSNDPHHYEITLQ